MQFNIDVRLHRLHCTTPTDEGGEDEPYLWAFFIKVDGSTLRQRFGSPTRLSANVVVHSGSGRPGNLGVSQVVSGSNVHIPPAVGHFHTLLRPIALDLEGAGSKLRIFSPGMVLTMAVLAEQDAVPPDAVEGAFIDVKQHVQNRLNDLINDLDLAPIISTALASGTPAASVQASLRTAFADFQTTIAEECRAIAKQSAEIAVMASGDFWNPIDIVTQLAAALDPDDVVDTMTLRSSEQSLIANSLNEGVNRNMRENRTGLDGAWYILTGGSSAELRFAPGDLTAGLASQPAPRSIQEGAHTVTKGRRCLKAGTQITYKRVGFSERHMVSVTYPFLTYRYFLDGTQLTGNSGKVTLNKTVTFPEFDESKFYLIGGREENRQVTVSFETKQDPAAPQLQQLFLGNNDNDGCYAVELRIDAVLPDGRTIPVGITGIKMTGQVIQFGDDFLDRYTACIADYLKSLSIRVKPAIPDQWKTPEIRWNRLNAVVERLEALRDLQLISPSSVNAISTQIATKLGLSISPTQGGRQDGPG